MLSKFVPTACPHDCPSTCALEVERIDSNTIGKVRGARDNPYTAGVICTKVSQYRERVHHPNRLMYPLKRVGPKGEAKFSRISWDEALDESIGINEATRLTIYLSLNESEVLVTYASQTKYSNKLLCLLN